MRQSKEIGNREIRNEMIELCNSAGVMEEREVWRRGDGGGGGGAGEEKGK